MSRNIKVEFTIEPFVDGNVPAYVQAAVEALRARGIEPELGPFGTLFIADSPEVGAAVGAVVDAAYSNGATYVSIESGPAE